jgi:hypothetical protein
MLAVQGRVDRIRVHAHRIHGQPRAHVHRLHRGQVHVVVQDDEPIGAERGHAVIADDNPVHARLQSQRLDALNESPELVVHPGCGLAHRL